MTDRKGQVTEYRYDALNRLTELRDHDGRVTTYTYDLAGRLARISDSQSGELLKSYDNLDRLTEVFLQRGGCLHVRRDRQAPYTRDRRRCNDVRLRQTEPADQRNASRQGGDFAYDAVGRLAQRVLPNGMRITYQYDAADRVTSIAYTKPDNTTVETITYSHDAVGQRSLRALGGASLQETALTATYDEANRLSTIAIGGEAFTLAYDDNGNLFKAGPVSGTTLYTWDARNQLVGISGPGGSASFKYDGQGRRIEKTMQPGDGLPLDGRQVIAELKAGALDTVYHTAIAIDEVLARHTSAGAERF